MCPPRASERRRVLVPGARFFHDLLADRVIGPKRQRCFGMIFRLGVTTGNQQCICEVAMKVSVLRPLESLAEGVDGAGAIVLRRERDSLIRPAPSEYDLCRFCIVVSRAA